MTNSFNRRSGTFLEIISDPQFTPKSTNNNENKDINGIKNMSANAKQQYHNSFLDIRYNI